MTRRKLVAGNWKLNGNITFNNDLITALNAQVGTFDNVDVIVCPPVVYIPQVAELAQAPLSVAAQNVAAEQTGAFTGEVSAKMLAEFGCKTCLVGHSERRSLFGDDDASVAARFAAAQAEGFTVILCVGETEAERDAGDTLSVINQQLQGVIDADATDWNNIVIAYEPVWAIGTGKTASPEQAQEVHAHIRQHLAANVNGDTANAVQIVYGGSMKPSNAAELLAQTDIDGGLIGGASLKAEDFLAICAAADAA